MAWKKLRSIATVCDKSENDVNIKLLAVKQSIATIAPFISLTPFIFCFSAFNIILRRVRSKIFIIYFLTLGLTRLGKGSRIHFLKSALVHFFL